MFKRFILLMLRQKKKVLLSTLDVLFDVFYLYKVIKQICMINFILKDVYDAIPTIVTTFVAIISKISIFIFLLELVHYTSKSMFDLDFSWTMSLLFSSLLSLAIGTIVGLTQSRIKRLYAFSTISHVGFILLGLSIHSIESTQAFMFYLMQYSISNLNAFMLIITIGYSFYSYAYKYESYCLDYYFMQPWPWLPYRPHSEFNPTCDSRDFFYQQRQNISLPRNTDEAKEWLKRQNRVLETHGSLQEMHISTIQLIDQLRGFYYLNPVLSLSLAITLFSFAGIPPLIGFFGKQMVLSAAIDSGYIFMSLVAILTSVISAVYYLAIIKQMFFFKPDLVVKPQHTLIYSYETLHYLHWEKDDKHSHLPLRRKNYDPENTSHVVISSSLSLSISIITFIISLFIFIPQEWLSIANLLALILFNI